MRRISVCIAVLGCLCWAHAGCADNAARSLVEKAIEAQGGKKALARAKIMRTVTEGTASFFPNAPETPVTVEELYSRPDKYKSTITMTVQGTTLTMVQVLNGDQAFAVFNGMVTDLPPEAQAELKAQDYSDKVTRLMFLDEPGVELSLAGEEDVEGKPAAAVLVKAEGQREVKLYFDKESRLLVKAAFKASVPGAGQVHQEVLFSDYQEQEGFKYPARVVVRHDGRKVIDGKVTKLELLEKIDDKEFARP